MKRIGILGVGILMMLTQNLAHAAGGGSTRAEHRWGFYASLLGDPFPNLWGFNLAANIFDFLRVNAGYGTTSAPVPYEGTTVDVSLTTYGGGFKLFVPNWNLSPTVGLNYVNAQISASTATPVGLYGISTSGPVMYITMGIDWQTHYGLIVGAGYNLPVTGLTQGLPYVNLGWMF